MYGGSTVSLPIRGLDENVIQMQENSVTFSIFWVRYKLYDIRYMYLKCKQKLCGFPEDINSDRGKILIHKFHKKLLKEIHKKLKSKSVPNTA